MSLETKITIGQARKILGDTGKNLSDKQMDIILRSLYALAVRVIQNTNQTI
jgi:hypothetical protein